MTKFQKFLMEKRVHQLVEAMENMTEKEILDSIEIMDDESYAIFEAILEARKETPDE